MHRAKPCRKKQRFVFLLYYCNFLIFYCLLEVHCKSFLSLVLTLQFHQSDQLMVLLVRYYFAKLTSLLSVLVSEI